MILGLLPGCLTAANVVGAGVTTASLMCDWNVTRAQAADGWPNDLREASPILGPTPTPRQVDRYFSVVTVLVVVGVRLLPEWLQPTANVAILAVEAPAINGWVPRRGLCGR